MLGRTKEKHFMIDKNLKKQLNGTFYLIFYFKFLRISYDKLLQIDSKDDCAWCKKGNVFYHLR